MRPLLGTAHVPSRRRRMRRRMTGRMRPVTMPHMCGIAWRRLRRQDNISF